MDKKSNKRWTIKRFYREESHSVEMYSCDLCGVIFRIEMEAKADLLKVRPPNFCPYCGCRREFS